MYHQSAIANRQIKFEEDNKLHSRTKYYNIKNGLKCYKYFLLIVLFEY